MFGLITFAAGCLYGTAQTYFFTRKQEMSFKEAFQRGFEATNGTSPFVAPIPPISDPVSTVPVEQPEEVQPIQPYRERWDD